MGKPSDCTGLRFRAYSKGKNIVVDLYGTGASRRKAGFVCRLVRRKLGNQVAAVRLDKTGSTIICEPVVPSRHAEGIRKTALLQRVSTLVQQAVHLIRERQTPQRRSQANRQDRQRPAPRTHRPQIAYQN